MKSEHMSPSLLPKVFFPNLYLTRTEMAYSFTTTVFHFRFLLFFVPLSQTEKKHHRPLEPQLYWKMGE